MSTVAELEAELLHRERQINAIHRITDALFSHTAVEDMVRDTLDVAIEVLDAEVGSLLLHDPKTDMLVFRYVTNPEVTTLHNLAIPTTHGIAGRVFRTGKPELTQDVTDRPDFNRSVDDLTGYHTRSMLTVPLKRFGGPPIGVMQILNGRKTFDTRDLEALEVLCAQAAAAVEGARLSQQARKAEIVNVLGDISHDIKNMLTPIRTGALMLTPVLDKMFADIDALEHETGNGATVAAIDKITEHARDDYPWILKNILSSADRLQARTLEIANAVKGELTEPVFEVAELNETVREVARSLRPVAETAGLNLCLELDFELPCVEHDRKQIYNALYNLVNNAIPETPAGGSVTIRTRNAGTDPATVTVEVADTGRGIPAHVRERLFTDEAISTKAGGTGLGTRIVAGVLRRHGGSVTVHSEAGEGSRFTLILPVAQR